MSLELLRQRTENLWPVVSQDSRSCNDKWKRQDRAANQENAGCVDSDLYNNVTSINRVTILTFKMENTCMYNK
jgi:hypothetical protein